MSPGTRALPARRRPLVYLLAGTLLCAAARPSAAPVSVADDSGATVTLPAPAQRVISLAPHLTELMYTLGAGSRLIATVESADYPAAALELPRIGDSAAIDMERVLVLQPDLVLAWQSGNGSGAVEKVRALGLPLFVSEPGSLAQIAATLRALGTLTGHTRQGNAAAAEFSDRIAALGRNRRPGAPVRVLYQIWGQPMFTVGGRHLISQIIELCGGTNIFADLPGYAGQVDVEAVLAANPELIVASGNDASRPAWLDDWQNWPQLDAVRNRRIEFIPPALIQRHSVRVLDGAEMMCRMIGDSRS